MSAHSETRLVGVGASAGGIDVLLRLVAGLHPGLPAAVFVALHQSPSAPTVLPSLLARRCPLPVQHARDGEAVEAGHVYVAPPDHHLLVESGRTRVTRGPRENGHRPGVDPLLRSLALEAGPAATGVILSGMLDDGAAGLLAMVRHGGTAVVQDPADALFAGMPGAALRQVPGAVVRPVDELADVIALSVARPVLGERRPDRRLTYEIAVARSSTGRVPAPPPQVSPAGLTCPDCSGPLFDFGEPDLLHYRCRVGHAWTQDSLQAAHDSGVENALYAALQALEEKAALQHRVAAAAQARGSTLVATRARDAAHDALGAAARVREALNDPTDGGPM